MGAARSKCQRCELRPVKSIALGLCEVCLYADATSPAAAARQVMAANADRLRRRPPLPKVKR